MNVRRCRPPASKRIACGGFRTRAGDGNDAALSSPAVTVTVAAPIPPSFAVKASPASLTVAQGASGAAVFTVTPAGGFNQAVAFSCGSGLPTGATTAGLVLPAAVPNAHWWLAGGGSLACLLMFGLPRRRRAAGPLLVVLLLAVGLLGAGLGGCSSGSTPNANATPPGTYTLKIAATAGTGSSALSDPVSVTLNVTN